MTEQQFKKSFLYLIVFTWLLPPMVGFSFLIYIEVFTIDQVVSMMSTPLKPVFLLSGIVFSLFYFGRYSSSLSAYLASQNTSNRDITERALRRFPLHFWGVFLVYMTLAPAMAILSLETVTDYRALPVDWFRIHLVALIVSIIVGLPIFISIYDLFGRAFGEIHLHKPILTIKTKVFLIGALIPLLIDTMLVQYFWTRTGFFSTETFFIWLLLEFLAIAGALLFVYSFKQSLAPLKSLIDTPLSLLDNKVQSASTDELGIFANQLGKLLDEQQLHQERLTFSNELLKASHSSAGLSKLIETIVNRTCLALYGDVCLLSLYDVKKNKLVCVAHSNAGYKEEGHFEIDLNETSIHVEVFKTSKVRVVHNVPDDLDCLISIKKMFDMKSTAAVPLISDEKIIGVLQMVSTENYHHYNKFEINVLQAFAQEAAVIQTFFEGLKHRRKAETAITQIMQAVSTSVGADFFNAITIHMADILQADSCGVVSLVADNINEVETLTYLFEGKIIENVRYELKGTPCETIIGKQAHTYRRDIQITFPDDQHLSDSCIQGYVGIPLFNSYNKPLGLLFAMFKNPIEDVDFNESVMHIFAARTSAEIERTQTEERIKHMAYYDGLTNLPNREFLLDRLQQAIARSQREQTRLAVLILDLDHFKKINDSLGHPVGDGLLIEVAKRLQKCIRSEDTVARLGGDEFVMLLAGFKESVSTINYVSQIAKQINASLKKHYLIDEHHLMMTSSCGVAVYPDDGDSAELLIKHADIALYKAKENGRDNYHFFSSEMNVAAMERLEMESEIHRALEENQFEVAFQPKVSVKDNSIIGAEILLRWNHPQKGYIPPDRFIAIADETGQIIQLGDFIFQQACIQTSELWCNTQCCDEIYSLSVNVSPRQFKQDDFVEKIKNTLQKHKTNPCCIELEVTENILINDTQKASDKLQELKDVGLKVAIDDFGTGYASLRYLQQLPIGMIKIDRSFITHIAENKNDLSIVKTIITMAENLDIKVIAEGVETSQQLEILRQLGCEFYQGYYFSKPITRDEFVVLVKQQREQKLVK